MLKRFHSIALKKYKKSKISSQYFSTVFTFYFFSPNSIAQGGIQILIAKRTSMKIFFKLILRIPLTKNRRLFMTMS